MNVLVTGANGQLGSEIKLASNNEFFFTDIDKLNICERSEIEDFVKENKIDIIINCAAYTNVDMAEEEFDLAQDINTEGVATLASVAANFDINLVHISTDFVFNGRKKKAYYETDRCSPISVYGKTKRDAEIAMKQSGCKGIIIRTSWLYSTSGKNFLTTIINLSKEQDYIEVVDDQIGTPTYARDLAEAIIDILPKLLEKPRYGEIFHYSNEGECSKFEFASRILSLYRLNTEIYPISSEDYPNSDIRPMNSALDKSLIKNAFDLQIPLWGKSLAKAIKEIKLKE